VESCGEKCGTRNKSYVEEKGVMKKKKKRKGNK